MDAKMTDNVNHPDHYARYRFECEPKDLTKYLPHPLASAIEYIIRAPFKGNELEDLKKAVWWLTEFQNTDEFWIPQYALKEKHYFCRLLKSVDHIKVSAAAFAIMSRCGILRFGLFDYEAGKYDFPRYIQKSQVETLIEKVDERIKEIESEQPSE